MKHFESISMAKQLSLAVHLHLYYTEMWPDIKHYLQNIGDYPYDLYVTMVQENKELAADIKSFHPQAKIWVVENRGYDVGPFVYFLHQIDLQQYDLILKIHSKNSREGSMARINGRLLRRQYWYRLLIEALIGSSDIFRRNILAFNKDNLLGMIGSKYCITSNPQNSKDIRKQLLQVLAQKFNLPNVSKIRFVAGTMFMIRGFLLQQIKDNYCFEDFTITNSKIHEGTLAHVLERLVCVLPQTQRYKLKGFDKNYAFEFDSVFFSFRKSLFSKKITKHGYMLIKICKIPVYHKKVN